jgi:nicotinate-nucleotide adenylyltransferase
MKKIGILGGSFDPPHISHKSIVDACLEKGLVDEVWVLPTYNHTQKNNIASFEQRIKMCKMLFCKLFGKVKVQDFERCNRSGCMYDMIAILRSMFENYHFYVIIGRDCADNIDTWMHTEALLQTVPFIVFERGDYAGTNLDTWYFMEPHKFLSIERCDISSTEVRGLVKRKLFNLVRVLTNQKVSDFIRRNKLYEDSSN